MQYFNQAFSKIKPIKNNKKSIITIGNFDGFHIYHQKIINQVIDIAKKENLNSIVISFDKKIKNFVESKSYQKIATKEQKLNYINNHLKELDYFYDIKVNKKLTLTTREDFINDLKTKLNVVKIIEGEDFRFGWQAKGDINYLIAEFGVDNVIVEKRDNDISSSNIKKLIKENKIQEAKKLLGIDFD
ncbi:riboflavin kinase [Mycoplasma sp. HU2014]|uniref:riboflavin kinase n=1 Tax=Mycoplasma sp. HU2014 TaxID=1664275 RepID=UPI00067B8D60|nr:riboflavin kinase [Mycoplasma sp. HU2014]KNG78914.1 riboflavin biosynthesis protein RibF [Mycoplasma sp. HU2014]